MCGDSLGTGTPLDHIYANRGISSAEPMSVHVLVDAVSRVRLWKQQLSLFLSDPGDLEGIIWKSCLNPSPWKGLFQESSLMFPLVALAAPP